MRKRRTALGAIAGLLLASITFTGISLWSATPTALVPVDPGTTSGYEIFPPRLTQTHRVETFVVTFRVKNIGSQGALTGCSILISSTNRRVNTRAVYLAPGDDTVEIAILRHLIAPPTGGPAYHINCGPD